MSTKIGYRALLWLLLVAMQNAYAYDLPFVNLGGTNILDGGPIRPTPGVYWEEYLFYYHAHTFLDGCGNCLGNTASPGFNLMGTVPEFVYEFKKTNFLGGSFGLAVAVPLIFQLSVTPNTLGLSSGGAGIGNPAFGFYNQWPLIKYKGRPFFVHRLELDVFAPWGTNKFPEKTINPAVIMTYIDPYWAATLYVTEQFAISWRLFYLWCGQNKKTHIKPGQTFHMNYSMAYGVTKKCFIGVNGYFLRQLKDSTLCGIEIPNSRERVLGIGPGFAYFFPHEFTLLGHLYGETLVLNRSQGISLTFLLVKHF